MESIWSKTVLIPGRKPLSGDVSTETVIIGGGMAGILISYFLTQAGMKNIVLEADEIANGQTKNTTAKITAQHGMKYAALIRQAGLEQARRYAKANQTAIWEYEKLIQAKGIECDWKECPSYLYSCRGIRQLRQEEEAAKRAGLKVSLTSHTSLPFPVRSALKMSGQAQFHPLKFIAAISGGLTIYEHTRVRTIEREGENCYLLRTSRGTVSAKNVVFATHYPFINTPGYYFARMHQERSYCIAVCKTSELDGMYYGIDPDGLSFRMAGKDLILGGAGHRTGENQKGGSYVKLLKAAKEFYPGCTEVARWSAQDCMPLDGIPYIGRFSNACPGWYVATGFQKWGMTTSMVAARLLCALITKGHAEYEELFTPQRLPSILRLPEVLKEGKHTGKNLLRRFLFVPKETAKTLLPGHAGVVEYQGEKVGIYKEMNGTLHVVSVRCPHLGCELSWNPDELTWDCPCHGSRFTMDGNLLDGPAQKNIPGQRKKTK